MAKAKPQTPKAPAEDVPDPNEPGTTLAGFPADALTAAHDQSLTAADVLAMDYPAIAGLAGVRLGPNGQSPRGFFWRAVRSHVANVLALEEQAAAYRRRVARVRNLLATDADFARCTVTERRGQIVIDAPRRQAATVGTQRR